MRAREEKIIYGFLMLLCAMMMWPVAAMAQGVSENRGRVADEISRLRAVSESEAALTTRQTNLRDSLMNAVGAEVAEQAGAVRDTSSAKEGARLRVSVLTCGPGEEIYEYYGHSAIRVEGEENGEAFDVVFNYGVFDFNSGNFILRFALGHTDYVCAMQQTADFVEHHRFSGRYIDEQVLNLTQAEARRLYDALMENCKPENRVYRYNFFFDNCATRVRDKIEECIGGVLKYPERPTERSLRDAVHFYSGRHRWSTFGQDLLLGSEADLPATGRELEFVPLIMEQDFKLTLIVDSTGNVSSLVNGETKRLLDVAPVRSGEGFPLSPLGVVLLLLLAGVLLGVWEWHRGRIVWVVDSVALVVQGLAGLLVSFLFFFSSHPTVDSNWLVWVLNPLPLVGLYWQIKGGRRRRYYYYHAVAAVVIGLFLIAVPLVSQYFGCAAVLFVSFFLLRSVTNLLVYWKRVRADRRSQKGTVVPVRHLPLLAAVLLVSVEVQGNGNGPRVVVNITIDGLRGDLIEAFMPLYGEGGFRKMLEEGHAYPNVQYPLRELDCASAIATLATGTVPYYHGIVGARWLDRSTLRPVFCVDDPACKGLNTQERFSPVNLCVSTIGDELKAATDGKAFVYSVAASSDAAILSAGHAADGAFWLDRHNNQWATSTYFCAQMPEWVGAVNKWAREDVSANEDTNNAVCTMAKACFKYTMLGNDEVPDYLAVTLGVTSVGNDAATAYSRLDREIDELIAAAEGSVGKGNALFVLTSTGVDVAEEADLEAFRVPTGNFYIDRTASLLNMMLMAVYGQGNYIEAIYDNQIFLNHRLIDEKQLNISEVHERCLELLMQSEGVKNAWSARQLLLGAWSPDVVQMRNGFNPKNCGDIIVQTAPGWHLVNEQAKQQRLSREALVRIPVILYGYGQKAQRTTAPASVECVAATLAGAMRIRAPNACRALPLP